MPFESKSHRLSLYKEKIVLLKNYRKKASYPTKQYKKACLYIDIRKICYYLHHKIRKKIKLTLIK